MKKLITLTTVLFVLSAGAVFAQTSAEVEVSAEIEGSLSIENQNDLDFGTVSAGESATVDEETSGSAGKLFLQGTAGQQVVVTAPSSIDLEGPGDDISTTLSYIGNDEDNQGGAVEGDLGGGGGNVTLNASTGEFYIWIGGEFTTPLNQANGEYSADLTITIDYL